MTIPRATYARTGDVRLRFPYSRLLVERLKSEIPAYARAYEPVDKTWTVAASYAGLAVHLLLAVYPDAAIEQSAFGAEPEPAGAAAQAMAVLHLCPSAPPELIAGAYRILARLHHPDVGGDPETMTRLNAARVALRGLIPA